MLMLREGKQKFAPKLVRGLWQHKTKKKSSNGKNEANKTFSAILMCCLLMMRSTGGVNLENHPNSFRLLSINAGFRLTLGIVWQSYCLKPCFPSQKKIVILIFDWFLAGINTVTSLQNHFWGILDDIWVEYICFLNKWHKRWLSWQSGWFHVCKWIPDSAVPRWRRDLMQNSRSIT